MAESKEYLKHENEIGNVNISEEVIASIAALSATEVEGVTGLTSGINFSEIFGGKKAASKGIKVELGEGQVTVDLFLSIRYGEVIPTIAAQIQDKVMSAVESMTGLTVSAVNVHIAGVSFEKEKPTDAAKDE